MNIKEKIMEATKFAAKEELLREHVVLMDEVDAKRQDMGISSYAQFCKIVGFSTGQFSRIRRGLEQIPRSWVPKLAKFLEKPEEELIERLYPETIEGTNYEIMLISEDLKYLASVVEVIGVPTPLSVLMRILREKRKKEDNEPPPSHG